MQEKYPFNEHFRKHYGIPDGYFEKLPDVLLQRSSRKKQNYPFAYKIALALFLLALIWYPAYRIVNRPDHYAGKYADTSVDLTDIPDEVIDEYLLIDTEIIEYEP